MALVSCQSFAMTKSICCPFLNEREKRWEDKNKNSKNKLFIRPLNNFINLITIDRTDLYLKLFEKNYLDN